MHRRTLLAAVAVTAGFAGLIPAAMAGATTPPTSGGGEDPYCAAHLALEQATNGGDPAAIGPAADAAKAVAPPDVAAAIDTALANVPTDGPPGPEFTAAYDTVIEYVRDTCGFNELHVLAKDYSFGGIGGEVAAGPTIIDLDNQGTEYHVFDVARRNEGVTDPVADLLRMSDEELSGKVTFVGSAFSAPGTVGHTVLDLAPGNYIAVCFIPKGSTPEAVAEMMAAAASTPADTGAEGTGAAAEGTAPTGSAGGEQGTPHALLDPGMYVEFTVVAGGTTDTGSMVPMDMTTEMATATTAAG